MKTIKLLSFLFLAVIIGFSANAQKEQSKKANGKKHKPVKSTAKFINKTNRIIFATSDKVHQGKVYTGYLKKAKHHQRKAIKLFKQRKLKKATVHSYKARRLAFLAYKANHGKVPQKWRLNKKERKRVSKLMKKDPTDSELEKEVTPQDKKEEVTDIDDKSGLDNLKEDDGSEESKGGKSFDTK